MDNTKEIRTVHLCGQTTWDFGVRLLIQDSVRGNYVLFAEQYGGDGKVEKFDGTLEDFTGGPGTYGRDKGMRGGVFTLR